MQCWWWHILGLDRRIGRQVDMEVEGEGCCLVELGSRFEIRCASTASKRSALVGLQLCVVKKTFHVEMCCHTIDGEN